MTINATPISNTNRPQAYPGLAGFAMPPEILSSEICPNPNHRNAFRESGDPWPAIEPDALPSTKDAHLGKTYRIIVNSEENTPFDWTQARKDSAARMDTLSRLLPGNARICACGRRVLPGALGAKLSYGEAKGSSHFGGLMSCNLPWVCPVCAARYAYDHAQAVQAAVSKVLKDGGDALMVTFTLRHGVGDALADLLQDLSVILAKTKRGPVWQRMQAAYNVIGDITALEYTHSTTNGHHPHKHALLLFGRKLSSADVVDLTEVIATRYKAIAKKQGRFVSGEFGVVVSRANATGGYLVKWSASAELTSVGKDSAGRTPNDLLDAYAAGDKRAGAVFLEYAAAMKGRRRLVWSKGLRAALDLEDWTPTVESAQRLVLVMTRPQWGLVMARGKRVELLSVCDATQGSAAACWAYLKYIVGVDYDAAASAALLALQTRLDARKSDKAVRRQAAAKSALGALGDRL